MLRTIVGFSSLLGLAGLMACGPIGGTADTVGAGGAAGADGAAPMSSAGARPANPSGKQSLIWVWHDYQINLNRIIQNANSFTHVSPALYKMDYDYRGGVVQSYLNTSARNGLSGKDISVMLHAAGLKNVPLMFAGAGNNGTDLGIQNILNDPTIAQSFIDSQVSEAVANQYDGLNLDWEVSGTEYPEYGQKLIAFLTTFKAALHAQNMVLSFDLGGWYIKQCSASGGNGLVDMKAFGAAVDQAIIEDYSKTLGGPIAACPAATPDLQDCNSFGDSMSVMCSASSGVVSIGLISPDSNAFSDQALNAISTYGFKSVALWPDDSTTLDSKGIPNAGTWYSVLGAWLAR